MNKHLVFVYGTLRSGYHNHFLVSNGASGTSKNIKIGKGKTKNKYALYEHGIPYLVEDEKTSKVTGELYMVDISTLQNLDLLEGHPKWYRRKLIKVLVGETEHLAWTYFNKKQGKLIKSGDYADKQKAYI